MLIMYYAYYVLVRTSSLDSVGAVEVDGNNLMCCSGEWRGITKIGKT